MPSIPGTDDDLAAIHAAFAEDVTYTGAGLDGATVSAVVSDETLEGFERKSFEIRFEALPEDPEKGDTIVDGDGVEWRSVDIERRDAVDAWGIFVEAA